MHNAYMNVMLQIRNVPEESRRELKSRAAKRGESLNAYLLRLIQQEVERPTVAEVLERAQQRSEKVKDSTLTIVAAHRAERDETLMRLTDS